MDDVHIWHGQEGKCEQALPGDDPNKVKAKPMALFGLCFRTYVFALKQQIVEVSLQTLKHESYKLDPPTAELLPESEVLS